MEAWSLGRKYNDHFIFFLCGLGGGGCIHNLEKLDWSLRIRWLWLEKTDPSLPWAGLPIQVPHNGRVLFSMTGINFGNGHSTLFWSHRWLDRKANFELSPNLPQNSSQKGHQVLHSVSRFGQSQQGFRYQGSPFGTGPKRVYSHLGFGGRFGVAARSGWPTSLEIHEVYKLFQQACLQCFFMGTIRFAPCRKFYLGSTTLQVLHVACC